MRQCRDCDYSCPFYYSDSYTEDYGCELFGPEFKNNKLLDEDGVCHVPQIRIDYLAHMKNRHWALLEKQSYKYTSRDRKPVTSKNYIDGEGYKVIETGLEYDKFLFPYSKFYRQNMKGGHRHNHIYNVCNRITFRGKKSRRVRPADKKYFVSIFWENIALMPDILNKILANKIKRKFVED